METNLPSLRWGEGLGVRGKRSQRPPPHPHPLSPTGRGEKTLSRKEHIMRRAVVIEAVRTPIARAHPEKGMYRDVRADDLSADLMKALLQRANVPASEIDDIHWGCVKQEREQGYDVARMAALIAGFPVEVGGVTVNRNCGSSLQAVNQAAQSIAAECEDVQIAGGVEHMHHIPMESGYSPSPRLFFRNSPAVMHMALTAEN